MPLVAQRRRRRHRRRRKALATSPLKKFTRVSELKTPEFRQTTYFQLKVPCKYWNLCFGGFVPGRPRFVVEVAATPARGVLSQGTIKRPSRGTYTLARL